MNKPFEENKVFILVSDILVWTDSGKKIKKEPPKEVGDVPEGEDAPQ